MRILSWNINGIRTLPRYHPWNSYRSCEGILEALGAEIICFQEMKSSRATLSRDVALPEPYHGFFSFPVNKGGYSGVAVYTNSRKVVPLKAEEGLTGMLQPKPPLSQEERVSPSHPRQHDIDPYPDDNGGLDANFEMLDSEGRCLVLDFGLFVLINVYCPAETSDTRLPFKMNFHYLLQERVRKLIEEGREVIVIGDINISATPIDSAEGGLPSNATSFFEHPARQWFRSWLHPNGPMVDAIRSFWPDRKGLYTCWNMKLQARETNYGARIDYILITEGLRPWIKHGDIQASLKGSDHCPIFIDLHDEITLSSGVCVRLCDAMKQDGVTQPPRLCAKYWEELAGRQTVLSSFFGKQGEASLHSTNNPIISPTRHVDSKISSSAGVDVLSRKSPTESMFIPITAIQNRGGLPSNHSTSSPAPQTLRTAATAKRKSSANATGGGNSKRKKVEGQAKIASFFSNPSSSRAVSKEVIVLDDDDDDIDNKHMTADTTEYPDTLLAYVLSASQNDAGSSVDTLEPISSSQNESKNAWSNLFAPLQAPKCTVHREPAKLFTVNKQGPNKGKRFYICSRPVGPGYDKGKSERLREEVNHEYRCNYFKWASEVKKEAMQESKRAGS